MIKFDGRSLILLLPYLRVKFFKWFVGYVCLLHLILFPWLYAGVSVYILLLVSLYTAGICDSCLKTVEA